mmetsp:Transcript_6390/g.15807  ORF Transcript_6390/g.15807 Transcript_6390/m.15807 type:complete len:263 (-) Transcript_6390:36-824(-)
MPRAKHSSFDGCFSKLGLSSTDLPRQCIPATALASQRDTTRGCDSYNLAPGACPNGCCNGATPSACVQHDITWLHATASISQSVLPIPTAGFAQRLAKESGRTRFDDIWGSRFRGRDARAIAEQRAAWAAEHIVDGSRIGTGEWCHAAWGFGVEQLPACDMHSHPIDHFSGRHIHFRQRATTWCRKDDWHPSTSIGGHRCHDRSSVPPDHVGNAGSALASAMEGTINYRYVHDGISSCLMPPGIVADSKESERSAGDAETVS